MQRWFVRLLALISLLPPGVMIAHADAPSNLPGGAPGWNCGSRHVPAAAPSNGITSYALSPNGKLLAVGNTDHQVRLWRVTSGKLLRTLYGHTTAISSLAFSPDSATVAAGAPDGTVRLWNALSGRPRVVLRGASGTSSTLLFSPDGSMLAADRNDGSSARSCTVTDLWSTKTGGRRAVLSLPHSRAGPALFSPDGSLLVTTGGYWDPAQVWDVRTGKNRFAAAGSDKFTAVSAVAFSGNSKTLAVAGWRNEGGEGQPRLVHYVYFVRTSDGNATRLPATAALNLPDDSFSTDGLALSGDGRLIAAASSDNKVTLCDQNGEILASLDNTSAPIAFSADSTCLLVVRRHRGVMVWNVRHGQRVPAANPALLSIFPAALTHSLTLDGRTITLWDPITGRAARRFRQP